MYQFTEMFGDMKGNSPPKSYRWWGLAAGTFGGWLPAWGLTHWRAWGGWSFAGLWILAIPVGYFLGKQIKK